MCTFGNTLLDAHNTVLELLLGDAQVLVGVGQVLDLLIELLLDLRKLLNAESVQVDYTRKMESARAMDNTTVASVC